MQVDLQKAFDLAVLYARKAKNNPHLKGAYAAVRRDNQSAWNVENPKLPLPSLQDSNYAKVTAYKLPVNLANFNIEMNII